MWNNLTDVIPKEGWEVGWERGRTAFLCHSQNLVNKHSSNKEKKIHRKQALLVLELSDALQNEFLYRILAFHITQFSICLAII